MQCDDKWIKNTYDQWYFMCPHKKFLIGVDDTQNKKLFVN